MEAKGLLYQINSFLKHSIQSFILVFHINKVGIFQTLNTKRREFERQRKSEIEETENRFYHFLCKYSVFSVFLVNIVCLSHENINNKWDKLLNFFKGRIVLK